MDDLISRLSELRCQYNCFDENERDAYHTLSEAIKAISAKSERKEGWWILKKVYEDEYGNGKFGYFCSECGARMEVEE